MSKKIKQKYINQGMDIGYDSGRKSGLVEGEEIGLKKGFNKGLVFAQEYYEGKAHDEHIKQEVNEVESKPTNLEIFRSLEETLAWCSTVYDIADSDYFRVYLFENITIETIENMINYLNYLSMDEGIINTYPMTSEFLPEIIMSLHEVIDHKLILTEAEKVLKSL
jgi:hypothetical protein